MKTKLLCYAILFCIVIFLSSLSGCRQHKRSFREFGEKHDLTSTFGDSDRLRKIWYRSKEENIRRIILLGDGEPIKIPQECLEGYIELLDKAIGQLKIKEIMDIQQINRIKIITDKGEYFIPGEWMINISSNGIDSTTYRELWNYLEGCEMWQPRYGIPYDTSGWTILHSPRKLWPTLKRENIRKIIFCEGSDIKKADDWFVDFEVPQECLKGTIKLLDKAVHEQKKIYHIPDAWMGFSGIKIITDNRKYLVPAGWDSSKWRRDDAIYGADWASSELREYLRKCGWADPNN